jgi:hypothetical protein
MQTQLIQPTKFPNQIYSISDYFKWQKYLDDKLKVIMPIINSNKYKMQEPAYAWIKENAVYDIERDRVETFMALINYKTQKDSTITASDLNAICDTTLNGQWANWLRHKADYTNDTWYYYQYSRIQIWKRFAFDLTNDSLNTDSKRRMLYYNELKQNYQGLLREKLLQYTVAEQFVKELGVQDSVTRLALKDYYNQAGYPEQKQWVKVFEDSMRKKYLSIQKSNAKHL